MIEDTPVDTGFIECPRCAEHIRPRALVCRFCGFDLASGLPANGIPPPPLASVATARKSAGVAGLLSLVLPGLGHFYVGEIAKGIGFLVGALVALMVIPAMAEVSKRSVRSTQGVLAVFVVLGVILCVASIVSAVRAAHRANAMGPDCRRVVEGVGDEEPLPFAQEARTAIVALMWIIGGMGLLALIFKFAVG